MRAHEMRAHEMRAHWVSPYKILWMTCWTNLQINLLIGQSRQTARMLCRIDIWNCYTVHKTVTEYWPTSQNYMTNLQIRPIQNKLFAEWTCQTNLQNGSKGPTCKTTKQNCKTAWSTWQFCKDWPAKQFCKIILPVAVLGLGHVGHGLPKIFCCLPKRNFHLPYGLALGQALSLDLSNIIKNN
jgi:hypothetical protein